MSLAPADARALTGANARLRGARYAQLSATALGLDPSALALCLKDEATQALVNAPDTENKTLLSRLCALQRLDRRWDDEKRERLLECAALLLLAGAKADGAGNGAKVPPLHHAAEANDVLLCTLLIEHQAPIDERSYLGDTALAWAAVADAPAAIDLLLRRGADMFARTDTMPTPFFHALRHCPHGAERMMRSTQFCIDTPEGDALLTAVLANALNPTRCLLDTHYADPALHQRVALVAEATRDLAAKGDEGAAARLVLAWRVRQSLATASRAAAFAP